MATDPVMELRGKAIIDIGEWTCYKITFDASILKGRQYQEFSDALTEHGVSIISQAAFDTEQRREDPLLELLQDELSSTHPHLAPTKGAAAELFTTAISLPFPVRYALEVCLSNHFLVRQNITRTFLERLASMDVEQAIYVLEKAAEKQKVYYDPMGVFGIRVKGELTRRVPRYCVLSRGANVTPTMIHAAPSVVETSNRVIRKFITDSDRFLRVKFSDEKTEGRLSCQDGGRTEEAFDRVERAMTHGIVLCGRYYEFLAYGNSQFRENGAYFYAPTPTVSTEEIRHLMGSFDHIRTVAKWGARQGQCFSSTRAMSIKVVIRQIPDIERNGFCFTDGVGKLSLFLAQMAAQELGLQNPFEDPPSLFQFRLAGCKGVLALDPKVMGTEVHIRPSQYKFAVESQGLEIIRASALASANFNRQLIAVLSTLGVDDYVFITKQQEMVNYLEQATTDESVALERLQRNIDFNQTSLTMAGMVLDGFMKSKDPFMMSLLQLWRAYNMKCLKEKARIVVDDGAFVLGCVDEVGVLRGHYNDPQSSPNATNLQKITTLPEVFIQISNPAKKGFYKVIEGVCVMARNPSLHPGDIRIVRAVDAPQLRHLKNVLVLPQTGDRDLANMCSGGDLDGDDYVVLWDQDLIPDFINEVPMDFSAPKPEELDRPVNVTDIADFFVTYMKNDSLARIALAHLAQSDAKDDGVRSEECLKLAALHSQAVDYPKSGIAAIMDRDLKPRKWPHFMESKHRTQDQQYKSNKILGKLYDQVKLVDFKPAYENSFDDRILSAFELEDGMLQKAAELKESYDSAIRRLMAKHGIQTEFEAWSVFALSHNQEMRDYSFAEEFGKTVDATKNQFRTLCREAAGASSSTDFVNMAPFIAAMYTVTANEINEALSECRTMKVVGGQQVPVRRMVADEMPLMSFPWLFVNDLGKIATGNKSNQLAAAVRQGLAKKTKKHVDSVLEPIKPDIETQQGITHWGELLELDFDPHGTAEAGGLQSDGEGTKASQSGGSDSVVHNDDGEGSDSEVEEVSIMTKKMSALDRLMGLN
ncbi:RNA dependent RNA polymerase-domain-containing protein [Lophiotrema nucula]|uniref:RNA-dependent RNA polymerase n=1 Tax=Lophiotrema nucula TaxID=690887 RepID=A0A6A5YQ71_9PLEO|nr:RNA dependent RNA polymerase-domain-containing protein [Lophiotrema nucula]